MTKAEGHFVSDLIRGFEGDGDESQSPLPHRSIIVYHPNLLPYTGNCNHIVYGGSCLEVIPFNYYKFTERVVVKTAHCWLNR